MSGEFINSQTLCRRNYWINEIVTISGSFGSDAARAEEELWDEYSRDGESCLLDHLRLGGTIPETYGHDSSEEKLYSKYTDALLAVSFRHLGLSSTVLTERADAADVDCVAEGFSFVADAKAFRMSRTAKNQKDFKVEAMAGWKREKPYAAVVCPIYHLPSRSSQIYQQAALRNVAILTYSHIAVMCRYATSAGTAKAADLLLNVFLAVENMNPSKDATSYWSQVNAAMHGASGTIAELWKQERIATGEAVEASREEALALLKLEKDKIEALSHAQAISALLVSHNIPGRMAQASGVADNGLFAL